MGIFWQLQEVLLTTQTPTLEQALILYSIWGKIQAALQSFSSTHQEDCMLARLKFHLREASLKQSAGKDSGPVLLLAQTTRFYSPIFSPNTSGLTS